MSLTRVAHVDVKDGYMWITLMNSDGSTQTVKKKFRTFLLAPEKRGPLWLRLKGDGFFQFIKFYDEKRREYWEDYKSLKDKYTLHNEIEAARALTGVTLYEGLSPKDLCVLAFDIETNGLGRNENSLILLISCTLRKKGEITRQLFSYDEYPNQREMLLAWVNWINQINPNVICAYNGYGFDWPYLSHVAQRHGVNLNIGRDESELIVSKFNNHFRKESGQEYSYQDIKIFGRDYVDVMFLTMKSDQATRQFESYALKSVIQKLGMEREDRQHYDAAQIQRCYRDPVEWEKVKRYAIHDADDCLNLFEKFIPPYFAMTMLIPKSLQQIINGATGSQINSCLVASYLQMAHSIPKASPTMEYQGGMTIAKPGLWKDAFRVDVASLYPSICLSWNIHDPVKDPNNHFIRFLSAWTKERLLFKENYERTGDENAKAMSAALKILANSCYGMLAASGLNFNSPEKAAEITRYGRDILKKATEFTESQGFEVFFGDTDSMAFVKRSGAV